MNTWQTEIIKTHPIFSPIVERLSPLLACSTWPSLVEYNQLQKPEQIHFVAQADKTMVFEQQYEPRIYLKGEVQTRLNNWHDFFNMAVWLHFPATKLKINALQYQALSQRNPSSSKRTPIENFLTLLDENGAVIVSDKPELLDLIRDFAWHDLFWQQRAEIKKHMRVFIVGHSIYEKSISPYVGMTASAVLRTVDAEFMQLSLPKQVSETDNIMATALSNDEYRHSKDLTPFPLLGMPGWDEGNQNESYYFNTQYFRPKRASRDGDAKC